RRRRNAGRRRRRDAGVGEAAGGRSLVEGGGGVGLRRDVDRDARARSAVGAIQAVLAAHDDPVRQGGGEAAQDHQVGGGIVGAVRLGAVGNVREALAVGGAQVDAQRARVRS